MASLERTRAAPLYILAALLGGALPFGLEPLFVKMALPLFGGAPAVWNVAFGFFTTALLVGYLYAHGLVRLPIPAQVGIHAALLAAAALVLPLHVASRAGPFPEDSPALALLLLLAARAGLPFIALSATAPLVQSWFARTSAGRNPYPLYAASNAGSFAALLLYPFAIEPFAGLALLWTDDYSSLARVLRPQSL